MNDREILELIRRKSLDTAVRELYKKYAFVRGTLQKYGATDAVIPELFNDALVLLLEKAQRSSFQLTSQLSTYLVGICLNLWRNEHRKNTARKRIELDLEIAQNYAFVDYDWEKEQKLAILDNVLEQIQQRCQQLLRLFYFEKKRMVEIAQIMQFGSEQSAKTQKHKCMEKAQQLAHEGLKQHTTTAP